MNRWSWVLIAGAAAAGYSLRRLFDRRQTAGPSEPEGDGSPAPGQERRSDPDPEALARQGGPDRIGFDLEELRSRAGEFKPLVEHLTYIQVKRGEQQSLIFVRRRDLDTLAQLTGLSKEDFVEQFQHMGVMVSMN